MIRVKFFASVREQLGCDALELPFSEELSSLTALEAHLCATGDARWSDVLGQDNIIRAVNQVVVESGADLNEGDEVAFFPPVTGG